ncbi:restriction endonuclease subunit S [Flavobacterium filum]|uniref:restriction endonuclease subunit S n=1 Tax=Flavobacterium filum TaxID=370974 RepID=UPI0003F596D5|nr:restriction endonuclease subunit S [Flavobacterium filum]
MNKKKRLIPEICFPEFNNGVEWQDKTLGEVCKITNGKSNAQDHIQEGQYPLFDRSEVIKASNEYIFDTEAVIIPGEGMRFIPKYFNGKFNLHQRAYALKNFTINGQFVYYSMLYNSNLLSQKAVQSTVLSLRQPILQNFPILVPKDKREQQKIASCLSSLDDLIEAHNQKLELLKDHKKGLMQNLFPQEGEKVPKYRFKEFEQDGVWVEKPLDDICKLVRGPFGGALKKEIFVNEGYAVYEQSHAIYSDFSSFRYFIDEGKFNELKRFSVKSGDLIMSCSGTMGKFAIVPEENKIGVINQALLKLTVKKGYDNLFVKITLESDNNQEKLLSQSAGGAIKNIVSVSQIKELGLFIPSIKEQQKIASCLSSLDELITEQAKEIEQLKQHKKGLMQGLFPKMSD